MSEAPWARHNDPRSEYDGGGVMPDSTVHPKGPEALTAGDKLRLQSLTGQEIDPKAPRDEYHWYGGAAPAPIAPGPTEEQKLKDDRYK